MPTTRSLAFAVALGVATIGGTAACTGFWNRLEDGTVHDTAITQVAISGGGGNVTVVIDPTVKGTDIRRSVRYIGDPPDVNDTIVFDQDVVTLKTDCGGRHECDASYEVRLPKAGAKVTGDNGSGDLNLSDVSDVDVKLGSGNVTVNRASGSVKIENGSGDIELTDIKGDTTVETGSGNVTGKDLAGSTTKIEASSGDVRLDIPGTGDVTVYVSSGNIDVQVPDGTARVTAKSNSGDMRVEVTPDPASTRLIDLRTSSGDVQVRPNL